ncbi:MAG: SGNH/GDSL hydrolase family protein [Spirochaetales bacterium]|nr:MAG: SGNH/GDSL hydrolase family protein [Spirochaetales bacterium]
MESQLPYELYFTHRFNIHKLAGLLVDDYDIESIARIYGVPAAELKKIQVSIDADAAAGAEELKKIYPSFSKTIKAVAVGDSITSDRKSWTKILNRFLSGKPPVTGAESPIIDAGISGDTTSDVINRFYSSVLCHEFEWAVVFIGTNDCRGLNDEYRITNTGLGEYSNNLTYIMKVLKERHKKVISVTLPPVDPVRINTYFGEENNWTYTEKRISETNDFIRTASAAMGTRLADLAKAVSASGKDVLDPDGIHLNDTGQRMLSRLILDIFAS